MRFAFISDIHGNLHSLELVLADIKQAQADKILCLGDVASLGPQPREVIALLRDMEIPIIMGNHDTYLLNPELTENHPAWLRASELWCIEQLTKDDFDFLRSFQPQLDFMLDADTPMLCFHGSPRSNEEFLYPDTPPEILEEVFAGLTAQVLVGGHTHVQMVTQHKGMTLLNPGSVGMPFEYPISGHNRRALRRAEYAIVDMKGGKLTIDLRRLPIDFKLLANITRASGMPSAEFWLSTWNV